MTDETRIVDPVTGGEKGQKLARFELIPVGPLFELARLYGAGASKYEDRNWEKGFAWSLSYAAMQRHANQFWDGESVDSETKRHHLASVIFHAMALMEFEEKGKGTDDRPGILWRAATVGELDPDSVRALNSLLTMVPRVPDPLGHDQPSAYDVAPNETNESDAEIAEYMTVDWDSKPSATWTPNHIHHHDDHPADAPNYNNHKGCVPCPIPQCNCHHPKT